MNTNIRLLAIASALAVGEALAVAFPTGHVLLPVLALALVFTVLLGYGLSVPGWPLVAVAVLGAALAFAAASEAELTYREKPWLRQAHRREKRVAPARVSALRGEFARRVSLGLEHAPDVAALNRAILLGERASLPRRTRRVFADAGTIHVFAISGLHVMIVARLLALTFTCIGCPLRGAGILALPFLWGYVLLVGAAPSAVRAATMGTLLFLAPVFYRRPDGLTAWALTFIAVHLISPLTVANVGAQLSFAVMLALVLAGRYGAFLGRGWRTTVWTGLATWAASVPIVAHAFARVTPGGLVANLLLLPAAEITVRAGALGVATSFVSESLAAHLNNLSALFTRAMVGLSHAVATLPGANFEVRPWRLDECAAWYAVLFLVLLLVRLIRARRHPGVDRPLF